ncbi:MULTISPECIES: MarR family transcriptional regulator [Paraburkholderia]|uniref:MarR family transcriptional regulator n=1 Tax=Paraburkholderia TaxID=1822464 RepID=UPI00225ADEF2|nr:MULTISPECIES: MarR family transcriptional regulator [Paraburkholderia]MCX4166259.1 MarR family transcriptional regulator [Paraburkholderia megapolitana]MDN7161749.1 MarR family transcriptional regulator [Paraburkholderia sp. CHISQ3]MDQ6498797.1 MarR family transcriptional regulator [Paraburkholderia megapolitana]
MTRALSADKAALLAHASQSSLDYLLAQRGMREIARRRNDALRSLQISAAQFCLLALLYRAEPPTVSELAQEMQMETAHVSAQLSILMRRALVAAHAGQGERRRRRLTLTPYGQSVLLDALPLWIAAADDAQPSPLRPQLAAASRHGLVLDS